MASTVLYITRDRRAEEGRILLDLIYGNIESLYLSADAAKRAAWETEKVWKINLKATEESK